MASSTKPLDPDDETLGSAEEPTKADVEAHAEREAAKSAQLSREDEARIPRGDVFRTLDEANARCAEHDKAMGLPNERTQTWTVPIELVDGWLVLSPDGTGNVVARDRIKAVEE
jgi:hypothetical protein